MTNVIGSPFVSAQSSTIFLEVFGNIQLHRWLNRIDDQIDPYILFIFYCELFGWARPDAQRAPSHAWGLNDGGWDWQGWEDQFSGRIGWVQVDLARDQSGTHSLPIAPLLHCLKLAFARLGQFDVETVQFLLPLGTAASAWPTTVDPPWLNGLAVPELAARVAITIDFYQESHEEDLLLRERLEDLWLVETSSTDPAKAITKQTAFLDTWWRPDQPHVLTLELKLPEWSLETAAWTLAWVAATLLDAGVQTPVLLAGTRL